MNDINSLSHTKWNCKYHIVFAPKYRRKVFYGEKRAEVGVILRQLCEWKGVRIVEAEVCPDYVQMLIEIPQKVAVSSFMGYLKGKRTALRPRPSVNDTDVQFRAKLHRLSRFSPHNGPNKGLAHADDPVRYAVGTVIVHVLLLLIDGADRAQTLRLARGQIFSEG